MHGSIFDTPSPWIDEELTMFADSVARFLADVAPPERTAEWREAGVVPREAWQRAAEAGLLGVSIAPEYGGAGGDFRHEAVIIRAFCLAGLDGWGGLYLHNAICAPYIQKYGTEEQKQRWLPKFVSGQMISAIAMSEPGAGSDLKAIRTTARRKGDRYIINGQKTFITNGQTADLILVAAKTDQQAGGKSISLIGVEASADGFRRGRNLDKIGLDMADTSELFFDDVSVPAENLIGEVEGQGFPQLMQELPKERLIIALECVAMMEAALLHTVAYVTERKAFGQRVLDFQNTQFRLAECKTEATIARVFCDECVQRYLAGTLDAVTASMAKYWVAETAQRVIDTCQQLFGGYGYMNEYPIAQLYKDVRVKRIYGGTTEIMKLLIARTLEPRR